MDRFRTKILGVILGIAMLFGMVPVQAGTAADGYVTREHAVASLLNTVGLGALNETESDLTGFSDSSQISPQYTDEMGIAVTNGILTGTTDKLLKPGDNITRLEFAVIVSRAIRELPEIKSSELFKDVPIEYMGHVNKLVEAGLFNGYGNGLFGAGEYLTQEQLSTLMSRIQNLSDIRLQDDFYYSVNREWLTTTKLPAGYPGLGSFDVVDLKNGIKIRQIIQSLLENKDTYPKGSIEQKIVDFYGTILDMENRNKQGIEPIKPYLDKFESTTTINELLKVIAEFEDETGLNPLFSFGPSADLMDSSRYRLYGSGLSTNLPAVYILSESPQIQNLYLGFLAQIFEFSGLDSEKALEEAQTLFALEKELAANTMSNEEASKVENRYNLYSRDDLIKLFDNADLDSYLTDLGYGSVKDIVITDVKLMKKTGELLSDENLDTIKAYIRGKLMVNVSSFLTSELKDVVNNFNSAFMGVSSTVSDEEQAFGLLNSVMSSYLGRMYVESYFSEEAKKDVESIVDDIIATFRKRIEKLVWMSSSTKAEAIKKLDAITVKIGYPDEWADPFKNISVESYDDGGSLLKNIFAIASASARESKALLNKPVDKSKWMMPAHMVNAYYNATNNEIVFPAGILQEPFYDINASREKNLGGIGTVIAHEITHAFDNNGAQFDEKGNKTNWWTEEDYAIFQQKCQNVIDLYNGIEIAPGAVVNGALTVSENVADIGAMACILDIAKGIPNCNYKELFENHAVIWRFTGTSQIYQLLATQDVHSPCKLRSNMVIRNFQEFYDTYGITPEDNMYLAPEKRVSVW